jgi:hypothetical protein
MPITERPLDGLPLSGDYRVSVARTAAEIETFRSDWDLLNQNPNSQIDFFNLINASRSSVLRPHVISIRQAGAIRALVVGRVVKQEFGCSFGYKTITCGEVHQLDVLYGGLLGTCDGDVAEIIIRELVSSLDRGEADVIYLSHIKVDSDLFRAARRLPGFRCRDRVVQTQLHWKAHLPASLEDFLLRLNKKHRYWARRVEKSLNKDFPGKVKYRSFDTYTNIEELADDLEEVSRKTYQRRLGAGFVKNPEQMQRLALGRKENWLRGTVLHVDDKPCAFWIGSVHKKVFHSEATGYNSAYRKYELGTVVFLKLVEDLCREKVASIDFGLGDALYKRRFGDESWQEGSVRIYASSFKGTKLNLIRTILEGSALAGRQLANRIGIEQRLKTLWRKKLASDQESNEPAMPGKNSDAA